MLLELLSRSILRPSIFHACYVTDEERVFSDVWALVLIFLCTVLDPYLANLVSAEIFRISLVFCVLELLLRTG